MSLSNQRKVPEDVRRLESQFLSPLTWPRRPVDSVAGGRQMRKAGIGNGGVGP